jgi:L-lysine 2,3-aminomutase
MDRRFVPLSQRDLERLPQLQRLSAERRLAMRAVASVLPFRTNAYVVEDLIDWDRVPDDPLFQLTFPQPGMLDEADLRAVTALLAADASSAELDAVVAAIRTRLNPHPAGQLELNVPRLDGEPVRGVQHKYRETVLFFPAVGQTCHAYCTYCFRWPQFVGMEDLRFAADDATQLVRYLHTRPDVTNVLFTGGDPMVMRASVLRRFVEPLLDLRLPHLAAIRIGTKSLSYWPMRFTTDRDADDLLRLFDEVVARGLSLALMAHFSHPRELETPEVQAAVRRIRSTGAVIRTQAPLVRHVNDDPLAWSEMWRLQVRLGMVPYYMFVERDTGPRAWFEVPLVRAVEIFREATARVGGLARTVRGPSMSATPGKVVIDGVARVAGEDVFVLRFLQARDPDWVGRPFFARFDPEATWFDQLRPAFGEQDFFFERAYDDHALTSDGGPWAAALTRRHLPVWTSDT